MTDAVASSPFEMIALGVARLILFVVIRKYTGPQASPSPSPSPRYQITDYIQGSTPSYWFYIPCVDDLRPCLPFRIRLRGGRLISFLKRNDECFLTYRKRLNIPSSCPWLVKYVLPMINRHTFSHTGHARMTPGNVGRYVLVEERILIYRKRTLVSTCSKGTRTCSVTSIHLFMHSTKPDQIPSRY